MSSLHDGTASDPIPVGTSPLKPSSKSGLKQARLPFVQLGQKPIVTAPVLASKKRKLSDNEIPAPKVIKTNKSNALKSATNRKEDNKDNVYVSENEVSSSSETENIPLSALTTKPASRPGLLDRYIEAAQQREVSTSVKDENEDGCVSLLDEKENEKEAIDRIVARNDKLDRFIYRTKNSDAKVIVDNDDDEKKEETINEKDDSDDDDALEAADISAMSVDEEVSILMDKDADNSINEQNTSVNSKRSIESEATPAKKVVKLHEGQSPVGVTESTSKSPAIVRKTPASGKKLALEAERQRKREEREREKQEKLRLREEAKLERERKKDEEKKRKEQEKLQKEKEKQDKKEQVEKERLERLKQKEDEKKKKNEAIEEEKRRKEEEKKLKESEKNKIQNEKLRDEEEKMKKQQKLQQSFRSFFVKNDTSPVLKTTVKQFTTNGFFRDFQVKDNMRLAPSTRFDSANHDLKMEAFDDLLTKQDSSTAELYLHRIKSTSYVKGKSGKTWKFENESDVVAIDDNSAVKTKAKLIQFHENYRPPYYGTWRKKSSKLNARDPFRKDENLFDYEIDSDDEWEEEEPGESLSHSEGEDEDEKVGGGDDADDDDEDGFFVPHGYLSGDEGCEDDEDMSPEKMKADQQLKARQFEMDLKRQCKALVPIIIGCFIDDKPGPIPVQYNQLETYRAVPLNDGSFPIPTYHSTKGSLPTDAVSGSPASRAASRALKKPVPEEAMSDLIRLVHGNICGIKKLIREFREYWRLKNGCKPSSELAEQSQENNDNIGVDSGVAPMEVDAPVITVPSTPTSPANVNASDYEISKRQVELKINAIAQYKKDSSYPRKCWYVNPDMLSQYKLTDLPIPGQWQYVTKQPVSRAPTPLQQKDEREAMDTSTPTATSKTSAGISIKQFTVKSSPADAFKSMPIAELTPPKPIPVIKPPRRITLTSFLKPNSKPTDISSAEGATSTEGTTSAEGVTSAVLGTLTTGESSVELNMMNGSQNSVFQARPEHTNTVSSALQAWPALVNTESSALQAWPARVNTQLLDDVSDDDIIVLD
ncbi:uncharacterized protein LOC141905203 [Tubulanus polymorphus]|uniref:uncharacterized protein LOC141905203 n=1 Tax=Tubulanus polymorphus TaxID=672921 RepID=UPI003DA5D765